MARSYGAPPKHTKSAQRSGYSARGNIGTQIAPKSRLSVSGYTRNLFPTTRSGRRPATY